MKKLFCFLAVSALVLNSCDSSSDDGESAGVVLLKKTIETGPDGEVVTSIASYNGAKIDKITATGDFLIDFTYTGDLITKQEYSQAGEVFQINNFTYTDGKIATFTRIEPLDDLGYKEVFTHNSDGTISVAVFIGDAASQTTLNGTSTITISDNEVASITTSGFGADHTYTYDTKNHPFKNVIGYAKISYVDGEASGMLKNITLDESDFGNVTTTYTYLANQYPGTAVENDGGEETTTQFFY